MLNRHLVSAALASGLVVAAATGGEAQVPTSKQVPLKVTVTVSRYQGEKRISSLPYTLSVTLDPNRNNTGSASRRVGTKVPITTLAPQKEGPPVPSGSYTDVGTSIDCLAAAADESGRYRLQITVDESSIYEDGANKGTSQFGMPALRSFRTSESLMLREGQTAQMSSTPDRLTGEVLRVDVMLEVVK